MNPCGTCGHETRRHGVGTVDVYGRKAVTVTCKDCPGGLCAGVNRG